MFLFFRTRTCLRPVMNSSPSSEGNAGGKLSPSTAAVGLGTKVREALALLRDHWQASHERQDFSWVFADFDEYDRLLHRHSDRSLKEAKVFEIGFGARPHRLQALLALGVDASGVDAEVPILDGSAREYRASLRVNGFERTLKSLVRHILFDRGEQAAFVRALGDRQLVPVSDRSRFLIADATEIDRPALYDLIVSEDVFEHIEAQRLPGLVANMARWLKPDGLALIRPNIFTGITGGHLVEWNRRSFSSRVRRRSGPWDHLRKRHLSANSYLNELTRSDYRQLFGAEFTILEELVTLPDLGREFLRGQVAAELSAWPDEELFSNQVRFVLKRRQDPSPTLI